MLEPYTFFQSSDVSAKNARRYNPTSMQVLYTYILYLHCKLSLRISTLYILNLHHSVTVWWYCDIDLVCTWVVTYSYRYI